MPITCLYKPDFKCIDYPQNTNPPPNTKYSQFLENADLYCTPLSSTSKNQ